MLEDDDGPAAAARGAEGPLGFAHYQDRVRDLTPRSHELPPQANPFRTRSTRKTSSLTFNVAGYSRQLVKDFLVEGGRIEHAEFLAPPELSTLEQKVVINATGYGARALWRMSRFCQCVGRFRG